MESFKKCGITEQGNLHSSFAQLLDSENVKNYCDYLSDLIPSDDMDGFNPDCNDIFEDGKADGSKGKIKLIFFYN
jgi:hypothetical protein